MGRAEEHLLEAAKSQDLPLVQKLIHKGKGKLLGSSKKVNINHQDSEGFTALHQAAVSGNVELAYLLIDAGATVDLQDKKGLRPLHYCSWKGKMELVAALLESGSNCNIPSNNGCTPLHLAAQYGHYPACKILLQYGADISSRQSDGNTALDLSCEFGRSEVVELILHSPDSAGLLGPFLAQNQDSDYSPVNCPLHLAARNGHLSVVRSLLQVGLDINWRTASGTCLHEAVSNEKVEIVQLLIDCGIDITKRSGLGQTALELAKKVPKSPTIMEIIRKLSDAQPRFMQVYAINDFQNILDQNSLAFTKGTIITVMEQNPNGNWKGRIERGGSRQSVVGYFPASYVQPYQQMIPNNNMAGSDDSGIHPHDDDTTHWTPPTHWGRPPPGTPTKPPQLPHKYVNVDPKSSANQQLISKVTLVSPNVNNPSYEDVICSHSNGAIRERPITTHHSNHDQPITVSRSSQNSHVAKPHIANPGYEDVLLDQSNSSSPTNTCASAGSGRSQVNMANAEVASQRSCGSDTMAGRHHVTTEADEQVHRWLASFGMQQYTSNFVENGYDLYTIARASPSDLTAIRISKPPHRKKLVDQVNLLKKDSPPSPQIDALPPSVEAWLEKVGLREYIHLFRDSNVTTVHQLVQTTWEDLQEMGVDKLGHQKKLMLGISALGQTYKRFQDNAPFTNHSQGRHKNPPLPNPRPNLHVPPSNSRSTSPPSRFQNPPVSTSSIKPQQPYNPRQNPVVPRFAPPGALDPTRKPIVQEKPSKQFSSFRDSPGLSLELQKALTRRQKVIDDDEKQTSNPPSASPVHVPNHVESKSLDPPSTAPPPVQNKPRNPPTSYPPSSSQVRKSPPNDQVFRRTSSFRGPPPNPPKRTSSICLDDASPLASPVDDKEASISVKSRAAMVTTNQPPKSSLEKSNAAVSPNPSNNQMFRFPAQPPSNQITTTKVNFLQSQVHSANSSFTPNTAPSSHVSTSNSDFSNRVTRPLPPPPQGAATKPNILIPSGKPAVPNPAGKPAVTAKPKPAVVPKPAPKPSLSKKPQVSKQHDSRDFPPPVPANSRKPNHGGVGKHFDLSVLDRIDQQNIDETSTESVSIHKPPPPAVPAKPSSVPSANPARLENQKIAMDTVDSVSMRRVDSTDDFDWPAPPPTMLESSSDSLPPASTFAPTTASPLRQPNFTPPSPKVTRTCFEDDEDTGTVKRRPPSVSSHRDEVEAPAPQQHPARSAWSRNTNGTQFPQPTTSKENRSAPSPIISKPTRPPPNNDAHHAPPPTLPTKPKTSGITSTVPSNNFVTEANTDLSLNFLAPEDDPVPTVKAQQMLDDIGSMFDDLVQEFDDILN